MMFVKPHIDPPLPSVCEKCGSEKLYAWNLLKRSWVLPVQCPACAIKARSELEEQQRHHQAVSLLRNSMVPRKFHEMTLDGLLNEHNTVPLATLMGWNPRQGECLHLAGPTGRGKTTTAMVALVDKIRRLAVSGMFVTEFEIIRRQIPDLRAVMEARILVIDDLGSCRDVKDWAQDDVCAVLDYREREGLATLVTSEYTPKELLKRMPERIGYRWYHMCRGHVIQFTGPNYREALEVL